MNFILNLASVLIILPLPSGAKYTPCPALCILMGQTWRVGGHLKSIQNYNSITIICMPTLVITFYMLPTLDSIVI